MNKKNRLYTMQRGVAILLAMLVVSLVAVGAASIQWRQWLATNQELASRTHTQAKWISTGVLDWALLLIIEDARNDAKGQVDHLGEAWNLPLDQIKILAFLAADPSSEAVDEVSTLEVKILDAQSKINLTNLIENRQISASYFEKLQLLYSELNLPLSELEKWTQLWLLSHSSQINADPERDSPLEPQDLQSLALLGVPIQSIHLLSPYITILPARTSININTASAVMLRAVLPKIEHSKIQELLQRRAQSPFPTVAALEAFLSIAPGTLSQAELSVYTNYFEVHSLLRLDELAIGDVSLVRRVDTSARVVKKSRSSTQKL